MNQGWSTNPDVDPSQGLMALPVEELTLQIKLLLVEVTIAKQPQISLLLLDAAVYLPIPAIPCQMILC